MGIAAACTSSKQDRAVAELPCSDRWSDDGSGLSVLWEPTPEAVEAVSAQLPIDRKIGCWHRNPSGRITVVSADREGNRWATEFRSGPNGIVRTVGYDEVIVTLR
jgi:hypothetical protein